MPYIENIVIGKPLIEPSILLAKDNEDCEKNEKQKTLFTDERSLAKILVQIEIYPSISEIRRNRPELLKNLTELDFINELKVSKKRKIWIIVGE